MTITGGREFITSLGLSESHLTALLESGMPHWDLGGGEINTTSGILVDLEAVFLWFRTQDVPFRKGDWAFLEKPQETDPSPELPEQQEMDLPPLPEV